MKILLTGRPGIGKTTLIMKALKGLGRGAKGFYTEEIREGGARKGFRLRGLDGSAGVLSDVDIRGPHRVGRYGVDVEGFERFLDALDLSRADAVVIDEIGKMECLSPRFRNMMLELLDSGVPLLATIALRGTTFIEALKRHPGVRLLEITEMNRDSLAGEVTEMLKAEK